MKYLIILLISAGGNVSAQTNKAYVDSLRLFQQNYVNTHEVIKGDDRKYLQFFPVNKSFCISASFEKLDDSLLLKSSKGGEEQFYRYGKIDFSLNGKRYRLFLYQSPKLLNNPAYKDYLFLPFTDLTSGSQSYGGGRYIDLSSTEIKNGKLEVDFNKAYNPYCAYGEGYRCPIPPKENDLPVAVAAGERSFSKAIH